MTDEKPLGDKDKLILHLTRIVQNFNDHMASIELLLSHVSQPLLVDDRGLREVCRQIYEKQSFINEEINKILHLSKGLDITQVFDEIKLINIRLNSIEKLIEQNKVLNISMNYSSNSVDIHKEDSELLNTKLEDFELTVRTSNLLHSVHIKTIRELLRHSEKDLLSFRNFGRKSLNELKLLLKGQGLRLRDSNL